MLNKGQIPLNPNGSIILSPQRQIVTAQYNGDNAGCYGCGCQCCPQCIDQYYIAFYTLGAETYQELIGQYFTANSQITGACVEEEGLQINNNCAICGGEFCGSPYTQGVQLYLSRAGYPGLVWPLTSTSYSTSTQTITLGTTSSSYSYSTITSYSTTSSFQGAFCQPENSEFCNWTTMLMDVNGPVTAYAVYVLSTSSCSIGTSTNTYPSSSYTSTYPNCFELVSITSSTTYPSTTSTGTFTASCGLQPDGLYLQYCKGVWFEYSAAIPASETEHLWSGLFGGSSTSSYTITTSYTSTSTFSSPGTSSSFSFYYSYSTSSSTGSTSTWLKFDHPNDFWGISGRYTINGEGSDFTEGFMGAPDSGFVTDFLAANDFLTCLPSTMSISKAGGAITYGYSTTTSYYSSTSSFPGITTLPTTVTYSSSSQTFSYTTSTEYFYTVTSSSYSTNTYQSCSSLSTSNFVPVSVDGSTQSVCGCFNCCTGYTLTMTGSLITNQGLNLIGLLFNGGNGEYNASLFPSYLDPDPSATEKCYYHPCLGSGSSVNSTSSSPRGGFAMYRSCNTWYAIISPAYTPNTEQQTPIIGPTWVFAAVNVNGCPPLDGWTLWGYDGGVYPYDVDPFGKAFGSSTQTLTSSYTSSSYSYSWSYSTSTSTHSFSSKLISSTTTVINWYTTTSRSTSASLSVTTSYSTTYASYTSSTVSYSYSSISSNSIPADDPDAEITLACGTCCGGSCPTSGSTGSFTCPVCFTCTTSCSFDYTSSYTSSECIVVGENPTSTFTSSFGGGGPPPSSSSSGSSSSCPSGGVCVVSPCDASPTGDLTCGDVSSVTPSNVTFYLSGAVTPCSGCSLGPISSSFTGTINEIGLCGTTNWGGVDSSSGILANIAFSIFDSWWAMTIYDSCGNIIGEAYKNFGETCIGNYTMICGTCYCPGDCEEGCDAPCM